MTDFTDEDVERGSEAVAKAYAGATPDWPNDAGLASMVLAAVLPEHDKRVRAEAYAEGHRDAHLLDYAQAYGNGRGDALREAAAWLEQADENSWTLNDAVCWLRARADNEEGK